MIILFTFKHCVIIEYHHSISYENIREIASIILQGIIFQEHCWSIQKWNGPVPNNIEIRSSTLKYQLISSKSLRL